MEWFFRLFTDQGIAQAVIIYGLVIAIGIWLGRLKFFGISFGVTWILFIGLILSQIGIAVNKEVQYFLRDFGLILFVYSLGLQVGPGFFSSLKKNALVNNLLATLVVLLGVAISIFFFFAAGNSVEVVAGVMSGAVTNTPGLGAAQATLIEIDPSSPGTVMALAYALTYPFGVLSIILSLVLLKKIFGIDVAQEKELHRKLQFVRANKLGTVHINLDNKELVGQPLRNIFKLVNEPIIISRMFHHGNIITPTPDLILAQGDVLLVVAPKKVLEVVKQLIGSESKIDLKQELGGNLISRKIVVTRKEVTHKRMGDLAEIHQQDFTLTRLDRAGVEMVPHGNIFLQLGDVVNVVGTEKGVHYVTTALGNSLKRLEVPDLAPIFIGIVLGVVLGSMPIYLPNMPAQVKIGIAGGPLIVSLFLSRFGNAVYLNNYTTNSANLMIRELGITLFLASVGLASGHHLFGTFAESGGWMWILMAIATALVPMLVAGFVAKRFFRKTYFEICGLLAGASTDPPALAFALKMAGNDIPSATYATVYPLTMILRIVAAQLLILFLA